METNQTIVLFLRNLPQDLQQEILKRLKRPEILYLRAVCKSLRNTISLPTKPISPHANLVIPFCNNQWDSSFPHQLSLTISTVYAIQPIEASDDDPTNTWIVRIEELSSGVIQVKETLYRFRFMNPSVLSDQLPRSLNMLDYCVQELSKVFGLAAAPSEKGKKHVYFRKVVVSSYPDQLDSGFTLLALCVQGIIIAWRRRENFWSHIEIEGVKGHTSFEDVVYYNNKFYAVCAPLHVVTIDPETLKVTEINYEITCYFPAVTGNNFLVKSSKNLFWICKYWSYFFGNYPDENPDDYRTHVGIVKLDERNNQWIEVRNELENEVLFIGDGISFSLPGKGYSPCEKNSVYFLDEQLSEIGNCPGRDIGILKVGDLLAKPIFDFPGYSKLFWPPPTWLKQDQCSSLASQTE